MAKKVLFLLPYPLNRAPSQRFRVEAFYRELDKAGIEYKNDCFLNEEAWDILYKGGSTFKKGFSVLKGFIKRTFTVLFTSWNYDYVFVHREASPVGPPVFEWIVSKLFRKRMIFDFDDAIWIPNVGADNKLAGYIKCFWKTAYLCKWSYKVSAGNDFLKAYALKYNSNVVLVPTCVDTEEKYKKEKGKEGDNERGLTAIGWTGSHSTLPYLDLIQPVMQKLSTTHKFRFIVICNKPPETHFPNLEFIKWNTASEIDDLLKIDIGLMPLKADAWSEGKCGFKLIQYHALGIPALASPVGVNSKIIEPGVNGYLCVSEEEWLRGMQTLLDNPQLCSNFGAEGRRAAQAKYSIRANTPAFLSLFS